MNWKTIGYYVELTKLQEDKTQNATASYHHGPRHFITESQAKKIEKIINPKHKLTK